MPLVITGYFYTEFSGIALVFQRKYAGKKVLEGIHFLSQVFHKEKKKSKSLGMFKNHSTCIFPYNVENYNSNITSLTAGDLKTAHFLLMQVKC